MRVKLLLVVVALVFSLAAPALAQSGHDTLSEYLGEDYYQYIPPGMDFASANSMYLYNPNTGAYWVGGFYGMKALCYNHGGYYYLAADGGEYWNSC